MHFLRIAFALILLCAFDASAAFDHTHAAWGALLKRHLVLGEGARSSRVDYTGMSRDRGQLGAYLKTVSAVTPDEYASWPRAQKLAFLINAYNAFTVEKILTRYPDLTSIRDFGTVIGNPWKDKFFTLLGKSQHLDGLEHDTIRARGVFDDPRIHFAVVCASVGCPMLREEPFEASRLDRQLDEQVVRFLGDRTRNRYADGKLEVSKIFDWYEKDFSAGLRGIRSVEHFLAMYAGLLADTPQDRRQIEERRAKVRYLDYDWALNDVKR
jgi:hypothetical protein